jgi:predicted HTH transcriptional regulator
LIACGESPTLEFKESVFWDETPAKLGEKACHKSIAAFLNTDGGDLLIGVHDNGSAVGLEEDYGRVRGKRQNADAWLQTVTQLLINAAGNPPMSHVRTTLHQVDGKDVCRIHVEPSPDPVWVKESGVDTLYVRAGNTTRALSGRDAHEYARRHWR